MTPRQVFGHAYFAHLEQLDLMRADLAIAALGAQGDEKSIKKTMKDWEA
jgi:hypothetical protein